MSRVSAAESVQGATKFPKVKRVGRGSAPNLARKMGKAAESADTRPIRWFAYWWHPLVPAIFTIEEQEPSTEEPHAAPRSPDGRRRTSSITSPAAYASAWTMVASSIASLAIFRCCH